MIGLLAFGLLLWFIQSCYYLLEWNEGAPFRKVVGKIVFAPLYWIGWLSVSFYKAVKGE